MLKDFRFWALIAVCLASVLVYRSFAEPVEVRGAPPKKVAFITGGPGDYWQAAIAGAQAAADELGIDLDVRSPSTPEGYEEQMQMLSVAGSSDADAVAVSPIDAERQAGLITQIAAMKPIVAFDSDASGSGRHGYVGTSNYSAGLVAGTLVKKALPEGGVVVVLVANDTKENVNDRIGGFIRRIEESPVPEESRTDPRYQVLGPFADGGDNQACVSRVRDLVRGNDPPACFVTLNARQGPVVRDALQQLGKAGEIKLVAFDTPAETLDGIEDGSVEAAIAQDPFTYGYEAIGMINALFRGDQRFLPMVGKASVHISVEPVTKETLPDYRERIASRVAPTSS